MDTAIVSVVDLNTNAFQVLVVSNSRPTELIRSVLNVNTTSVGLMQGCNVLTLVVMMDRKDLCVSTPTSKMTDNDGKNKNIILTYEL